MLYIPNELADAGANANAFAAASQGSQLNGNASSAEATLNSDSLPDISTPVSPAELVALESKYVPIIQLAFCYSMSFSFRASTLSFNIYYSCRLAKLFQNVDLSHNFYFRCDAVLAYLTIAGYVLKNAKLYQASHVIFFS